jgi:hypothetical protein
MKSSSPSIVSLLPMAIGEGTFSLVVGGLPISVFSRLLPSALTRRSGERASEVLALRLYGAVHTRREPPALDGGEDMFCEALRIASQLGARPQVAHCHLGLGKLYRRTGNRQQAQEHLTTATTMYREMGMTYWLEQAETETQEIG